MDCIDNVIDFVCYCLCCQVCCLGEMMWVVYVWWVGYVVL